jgi:opacity protein-like surface antigen
MYKRIALFLCALLPAMAAPAAAQARVEVSGFVGWAFSDGVSGNAVLAPDGNIYDRLDPEDSVLYGFSAGFLVTPQVEVGFLYSTQPTKLILGGTDDRDFGDMTVNTYHGYFAYNFGEEDVPVRPFILLGLGATSFGSVDATVAGVSREIPGETQFSGTIAAGVKFFFHKNVGARAAFRFTPTYIKSDAAGWWCDPFWGCYLVGDAQYSNQVEFSGGLTFRF